jgi:hypothetical protein
VWGVFKYKTMSNFLSQPYEIQQPQSNIDVNVINKTLTTLEGRYNANKAKIDQIQAMYNSQLKGLRDVDNEYIAATLKEAQGVMENYKRKNGNLAYNSVTDTLLSTLRSVTEDPIIRNAITDKAKYDNYNAEVEAVKKAGKGGYDPKNEKFGLEQAGFTKY